jgi:hypothetical protein
LADEEGRVSLTQAHHVFASVSEGGINTFLKALCTARGHYINYGSSSFVPTTTAAATNMGPIPFPGVPGGIQWAISLSIPVLDLFPSGGASPLPPTPNTFNLHTQATIRIGCATWQGTDKGQMTPLTTVLDVWALGEVVPHYFGPGSGFISLKVDQVLLTGIQPNSLERVLECLLRMALAAALQNVNLPFHTFSLGAFQLILEQGPEISDNQVKVWGSI